MRRAQCALQCVNHAGLLPPAASDTHFCAAASFCGHSGDIGEARTMDARTQLLLPLTASATVAFLLERA